jgi:hypothetical protein
MAAFEEMPEGGGVALGERRGRGGDAEACGEFGSDAVVESLQFDGGGLIRLAPAGEAGSALGEEEVEPPTIALFSERAFEDPVDAKIGCDRFEVAFELMEAAGGGAGDHGESGNAGEGGEEVVSESAGEHEGVRR